MEDVAGDAAETTPDREVQQERPMMPSDRARRAIGVPYLRDTMDGAREALALVCIRRLRGSGRRSASSAPPGCRGCSHFEGR